MKYPSLFEELFVYQKSNLTGSKLLGAISIPGSSDEKERRMAGFLTYFIMEASQDTFKKFLTFFTGRPCLPSYDLQKVGLKFVNP